MAQEPEVIRQNIEETRSELTRKIEVLEQEVVGSVKDTTAAVAETVENVKDTVENTVENVKDTIQSTIASVKDTFDVRLQTQRHPWAVVGGCVFAGYVVGTMLPSTRRTAPRMVARPTPPMPISTPSPREHVPDRVQSSEPRQPSFLSGVMAQFAPEIEKLKGVAIGAVGAVVREMIKDKIPEGLAPHVQDMIHDVTHKLGGADVHGPILPQAEERESHLAHHEHMVSRH
jgi:ElaB/YqjD/DUF883 family membrane-anchored ribosome-binding protein